MRKFFATSETVNGSTRSRQVDVLRAFAIGVVLIHHYSSTRFFLSGFGVILFFVLSGYFATRTLLRLRGVMETGTQTRVGSLKQFYFNRWLRLWPPYFPVLGVTLFLGVEGASSSFFWNATFMSNFGVLYTGEWTGRFSPLWSLSVLEQFYLLWAVAMLFMPRRMLPWLVFAVIAAGPCYRLGCQLFSASAIAWCVVPFASYDQLGCGALLALCNEKGISSRLINKVEWVSGRVAVPLFLMIVIAKWFHLEPPVAGVYTGLIASFAFVKLSSLAVAGRLFIPFGGISGGWIGHMGRISYSIYLLHDFTELMVPKTGFLSALLNSGAKPLVLVPLTVLAAHLCWILIESPLIQLRKKFNRSAVPPRGLEAAGA